MRCAGGGIAYRRLRRSRRPSQQRELQRVVKAGELRPRIGPARQCRPWPALRKRSAHRGHRADCGTEYRPCDCRPRVVRRPRAGGAGNAGADGARRPDGPQQAFAGRTVSGCDRCTERGRAAARHAVGEQALRVWGALPGERVQARYLFGRQFRGQAETLQVLEASSAARSAALSEFRHLQRLQPCSTWPPMLNCSSNSSGCMDELAGAAGLAPQRQLPPLVGAAVALPAQGAFVGARCAGQGAGAGGVS